jgi:hypothetical protein
MEVIEVTDDRSHARSASPASLAPFDLIKGPILVLSML